MTGTEIHTDPPKPPKPKTKGRKASFTTKQIERMRDMRDEGLRNEDIGRIMGAGKNTVGDYILGKRRASDHNHEGD